MWRRECETIILARMIDISCQSCSTSSPHSCIEANLLISELILFVEMRANKNFPYDDELIMLDSFSI